MRAVSLLKRNRGRPGTGTKHSPTLAANKDEIAVVLERAIKASSALILRIPGTIGSYETSLRRVLQRRNLIVLSSVSPATGHQLLMQRRDFSVSGKIDGVEVRFTTRILDAWHKEGAPSYLAEFPHEICYRQVRNNRRVVEGLTGFSLRSIRNALVMTGTVVDLSRSGIGLTFDGLIPFSAGEVLPICVLSLPGGGEIGFSLSIRFSHMNRTRNLTRIGCEFVDIDADACKEIEHIVWLLEQENLRTRKYF